VFSTSDSKIASASCTSTITHGTRLAGPAPVRLSASSRPAASRAPSRIAHAPHYRGHAARAWVTVTGLAT